MQKTTTCKKCNGNGKLDWLEKITGKKKKYFTVIWDSIPAGFNRGELVAFTSSKKRQEDF